MKWIFVIGFLGVFLSTLSTQSFSGVEWQEEFDASSLGTLVSTGEGFMAGVNYRQSLMGNQKQNYRRVSAFANRNWKMAEGAQWFSLALGISREGSPVNQFWKDRAALQMALTRRLFTINDWDHTLSAGFQAVWRSTTQNGLDYWYGNQYDLENQQVDRLLPTGEPDPGSQIAGFQHVDLATGLGWWAERNGRFRLNVGWSVHQVRPAGVGGEGREKGSSARHIFLLSTNVLGIRNYIFPTTIQYDIQSPFRRLILRSGAVLKSADDDHSAWYHMGVGMILSDHDSRFNPESFQLYTRFRMQSIAIGLAYSFPLSGLARFTDRRGGVDISLIYRPGGTPIVHWY